MRVAACVDFDADLNFNFDIWETASYFDFHPASIKSGRDVVLTPSDCATLQPAVNTPPPRGMTARQWKKGLAGHVADRVVKAPLTRTLTRMRGDACARLHPRVYAHTLARTHARTHAPTHPRTHAHTHTRTHARTHAPTHPHTYPRTHPRGCQGDVHFGEPQVV